MDEVLFKFFVKGRHTLLEYQFFRDLHQFTKICVTNIAQNRLRITFSP